MLLFPKASSASQITSQPNGSNKVPGKTEGRTRALMEVLTWFFLASAASRSRKVRLQRLLRSIKTPRSTAAGPPCSTEATQVTCRIHTGTPRLQPQLGLANNLLRCQGHWQRGAARAKRGNNVDCWGWRRGGGCCQIRPACLGCQSASSIRHPWIAHVQGQAQGASGWEMYCETLKTSKEVHRHGSRSLKSRANTCTNTLHVSGHPDCMTDMAAISP